MGNKHTKSLIFSGMLCALPAPLQQVLSAIFGEAADFISWGSFIMRNLIMILILPLFWMCFHCYKTDMKSVSLWDKFYPNEYFHCFFFFGRILSQCSNSELINKNEILLLYMWYFDYIYFMLDEDTFRLQPHSKKSNFSVCGRIVTSGNSGPSSTSWLLELDPHHFSARPFL